jgi:hypothetical protein
MQCSNAQKRRFYACRTTLERAKAAVKQEIRWLKSRLKSPPSGRYANSPAIYRGAIGRMVRNIIQSIGIILPSLAGLASFSATQPGDKSRGYYQIAPNGAFSGEF